MLALDKTKLTEELTRDEGLVLTPYRDSVGVWTFGVGRNIESNPPNLEERIFVLSHLMIPRDVANLFLSNDIDRVLNHLGSAYPWMVNLTERRKRALANMCFQLGIEGFAKFSFTLNLIKEGKYEEAGERLKLSRLYHQCKTRTEITIQAIKEG